MEQRQPHSLILAYLCLVARQGQDSWRWMWMQWMIKETFYMPTVVILRRLNSMLMNQLYGRSGSTS